ncbi:MAG: branched chain amino acid aminotransferase [Acidimicrobiia bacterium]|nr:MAG: branched chain amino acid aminotransferase [Acidimicrobiia bacterium]
MTRIVNMWASPRNVSTAMMYAWAQRPDTTVWDEPMYGNFLEVTGIGHPMRDAVLAAMPTDAGEIVDQMLNSEWPTPVVFYKNMAHHLVGFDIEIVDAMDNFLLTRDPTDMLPSLARGMGRTPSLEDTGYAVQIDIVDRLASTGRTPIVVDSRSVLDEPEGTLTNLCTALDLDFEPDMLTWTAGPKDYDGVWGSHWYTRLHETTGFEPYKPSDEPLPESLKDLYARCAPLYDRLTEYAI